MMIEAGVERGLGGETEQTEKRKTIFLVASPKEYLNHEGKRKTLGFDARREKREWKVLRRLV
jgi:hypothetical protein